MSLFSERGNPGIISKIGLKYAFKLFLWQERLGEFTGISCGLEGTPQQAPPSRETCSWSTECSSLRCAPIIAEMNEVLGEHSLNVENTPSV
jgi:hypothetical protein